MRRARSAACERPAIARCTSLRGTMQCFFDADVTSRPWADAAVSEDDSQQRVQAVIVRAAGRCISPSRRPRLGVACIPMAKKYREVRGPLLEAGWSVVRRRGSHEIWAHPECEARIVVAGTDSDTVPVGTLGSIRSASGLERLR